MAQKSLVTLDTAGLPVPGFGKSFCSVSSISKSQLHHDLWTLCLLIQHTYTAIVHWIFFSIMIALFGCYKNVEAFAGRKRLSFPSSTLLWGRACRFIPPKWYRLHLIRIWQLLLWKKLQCEFCKLWVYYLPVQCLWVKLEQYKKSDDFS